MVRPMTSEKIDQSLLFFDPPVATIVAIRIHNAPHMRHPFVARMSANADPETLEESETNVMGPGKWHTIEVGRWDDLLWLKVDGRTLLQTRDPHQPHGGGTRHCAYAEPGSNEPAV